MLCIGLTTKAQDFISAKFTIEDYKKGVQEVELTFNTFIIGLSPEGEISYIEPLKKSRPNQWDDFNDNPVKGSKNLGNLKVTYFNSFDSDKSGKIKSIDGITFDYYSSFDIHDKKGQLKSIGKTAIKYNNTFDIHDISGTLKSIGNINVKYNNTFDMHEPKGTVKSIGPIKVLWYNAFDNDELRGKVKSIKGNTRNLYVTKMTRDGRWRNDRS